MSPKARIPTPNNEKFSIEKVKKMMKASRGSGD